jgi:hypothetical protein
VTPAGVTVVSSHPGIGTESVTCATCHITSGHTGGIVQLVDTTESTCLGCHSGTGSMLRGRHRLSSWAGQGHSATPTARAGPGVRGALLPPYARRSLQFRAPRATTPTRAATRS